MKSLFLLVLLPGVSFGALTNNQVNTAKLELQQMRDTLNQMTEFVNTVQPVIATGNTYEMSFSTNAVALTAAQQQDIVNQYQTLKALLASEYNALP